MVCIERWSSDLHGEVVKWSAWRGGQVVCIERWSNGLHREAVKWSA